MKLTLKVISLIFCAQVCTAQIHQEVKSFSESYEMKSGAELNIKGERLFVDIQSWEESYLKAEVEVVSQHENKAQAQADLEKIQVSFEMNRNKLEFRNGLRIPSPSDKPRSKLKTILKVYLPADMQVSVTNNFGELKASGAIRRLEVITKFCSVELSMIQGEVFFTSEYDKVALINSEVNMEFSGSRTDLSITDAKGKIKGAIDYGNMEIDFLNNGSFIEMTSEHTPVTLIVPEDLSGSVDVACQRCAINVSNCNSITDEKITGKKHEVMIGSPSAGTGYNVIKSKLEDVSVITVNSQTSSN